MRNFLLISLFSVYSFSNVVDNNITLIKDEKSSLVKEYQEMFEKIGEQRVGLDESDIQRVKPPFLTVKKKKKKEDQVSQKEVKKLPPLILDAILGRSARINGNWYKLHEKIRDAKIVSISSSGVLIKSETFSKKLTLRKNNANISIK